MENPIGQIIATVILTVIGILGVIIPYVAPRLASNRKVIGWAGAFGGGAFLSVCLLHLIPEAIDHTLFIHNHEHHDHDHDDHHHDDEPHLGRRLAEAIQHGHGSDGDHAEMLSFKFLGLPFNTIFVLITAGFVLILFIERALFSSEDVEALHAHVHDECGNHPHHHHHHTDSDSSNKVPLSPLVAQAQSPEHIQENRLRASLNPRARIHSIAGSEMHSQHGSFAGSFVRHNEYSPNSPEIPDFSAAAAVGGTKHPIAHPTDLNISSPMTAYLLMIALSVHNVFEGLVVGATKDSASALVLAGTIVPHHIVAGLALAMGFVKQGVHNGFMAKCALACFVLSSTIGCIFGIILNASKLSKTTKSSFTAFAAGTLLYVATCEIIAEEFAMGGQRRSKFAFFMLGVIIVAFVSAFHEGYAHDH